ncbi:MAG TPA: site-specific integrase [Cyclobacteriaceae bacterium]|nr:site-specific integrase [Cyclobacteriaceae bacterium]
MALNKDFIRHFKKVITTRLSKQLSCFNYDIALKHVEIFANGNEVPFDLVGRSWFDSFQSYLSNAKGLRSEKPLSHNSANTYFRIVLSIAKDAADERLIDHKAIAGISNTTRKKPGALGLSLDELQRLARTPCRAVMLKRAFLFSCLTGIQWKDIAILKWRHLEQMDGIWQINLQTEGSETLIPLNTQARALLGVPGNPSEPIFKLHYSAALCVSLNQWALKAGVLRNITFHSARHTFGRMLLDEDIPIELVSELLGHKHIKTTQKLFGIPAADRNDKVLFTNF